MMRLPDREVPGPRRDFIGYGSQPPKVFWPDDAKVAVNLVVNYEDGSEYSFPAGDDRQESLAEISYFIPPEHRDLHVESIYEFGSRAGVWRLLRLFDEYDIKVTFFACATAIDKNPDVGQAIQIAGHEPCSHGWRWEEPYHLTREEERQHIQWAIELIKERCGERPVGWLSRYSPSVHTRELLVEEGGFLYDADARNDDLPYFVDVNGTRHLIVPYNAAYHNDGRYVLAQGFSSPSDHAEILKRAVDELRKEGQAGYPKMMSVGLHPRWVGQAGRTAGLREFIEYALSTGDVWFARRVDIANWWLEHHEEFQRGPAVVEARS